MSDIVAQVKRVTDLINEISAATVEQTSGLNQINDAVAQLSDVTQQNAALVEQSAAAADSLRDQARQLVDVVSVFNLGQQAGDVAVPAPAPAPDPEPEPAPAPTRRLAAATSAATEEWDEF